MLSGTPSSPGVGAHRRAAPRRLLSASHNSRATTHALLPETLIRVETHVSHRKQTSRPCSTRDVPRHALAPFQTRTPGSRSLLLLRLAQGPCFNRAAYLPSTNHESPFMGSRVLIGTRERLEMRVSYRKQSSGCTSNRYSSPDGRVHEIFAAPPISRAWQGLRSPVATCLKPSTHSCYTVYTARFSAEPGRSSCRECPATLRWPTKTIAGSIPS